MGQLATELVDIGNSPGQLFVINIFGFGQLHPSGASLQLFDSVASGTTSGAAAHLAGCKLLVICRHGIYSCNFGASLFFSFF
jgi:hypothetical protein